MGILCDMQTPSLAPVYLPEYQELEAFRQLAAQTQSGQNLIENRNMTNQSFLQSGAPNSPHPRQQLLPNVFNFGLSDQQFQNQLLQRLQNINTPYRPSQFTSNTYQPMTGLYQPQNIQPQVSPSQQISFRVSQASSYSGSPVLQHKQSDNEECAHFIRPLSQVGTMTTTDNEGRTRIIVGADDDLEMAKLDPPPLGNKKNQSPPTKKQNLAATFSTLRVSSSEDDSKKQNANLVQNGPFITRSTSEKVPNRSELMSQVQRTTWARHTTK